jgi:hypothetical protein
VSKTLKEKEKIMASNVGSSLQDAYEIARYIHSFYIDADTTSKEDSPNDKPLAGCTNFFKQGPNCCYSQLERGVVLLRDDSGEITEMDTPLGRWKIAESWIRNCKIDYGPNGRITKIFEELEKSIRFVEMPLSEGARGFHNHPYINNPYHRFYSVTFWNGKQIEPAVYRDAKNFALTKIPYEAAKKIWGEFVMAHEDLAPEKAKRKREFTSCLRLCKRTT